MQISEIKKIGKKAYTFSGSGSNLFEAIIDLEKASFGDIEKCGVCESDNLKLDAYHAGDENYEYCKIKCVKCRASLTLGKKKKGEVFYLRRNEDGTLAWDKYVAKETK